MIRALIVLECVLLVILALDRVVGVPASGVNIDRAAREREISRHMSGHVQGGSIRAAIASAAAAGRPDLPGIAYAGRDGVCHAARQAGGVACRLYSVADTAAGGCHALTPSVRACPQQTIDSAISRRSAPIIDAARVIASGQGGSRSPMF